MCFWNLHYLLTFQGKIHFRIVLQFMHLLCSPCVPQSSARRHSFDCLKSIWCLQSIKHLTQRILHSCHCPLAPVSFLTLPLIWGAWVSHYYMAEDHNHQQCVCIHNFWFMLSWVKVCVGSTCLAGKAATDFEFGVFWSIMPLISL
jgi:hypothetical protein